MLCNVTWGEGKNNNAIQEKANAMHFKLNLRKMSLRRETKTKINSDSSQVHITSPHTHVNIRIIILLLLLLLHSFEIQFNSIQVITKPKLVNKIPHVFFKKLRRVSYLWQWHWDSTMWFCVFALLCFSFFFSLTWPGLGLVWFVFYDIDSAKFLFD